MRWVGQFFWGGFFVPIFIQMNGWHFIVWYPGFTHHSIAEWEQVPAARFQNVLILPRVAAVGTADYCPFFCNYLPGLT